MAKKATAKKAMAKKAEEVKTVKASVTEEMAADTVKAEETAAETAKTAEMAEVVMPVVTEKKRPGRKPGSKNKSTLAKEAAKKEEKKDEVFVQFAGEEYAVEEVMEKAKASYVAEGHRVSAIKSIRLYIKPEERKAYYVINEKAAGSIEL